MNGRANILARLRRLKTGAGRHVVGSITVAYLSLGLAPCLAASSPATVDSTGAVGVLDTRSHESRALHEQGAPAGAPSLHGHEAHAGGRPAHDDVGHDSRGEHCPHCFGDPGAARTHDDDHASCSALEDLANVAASQPKQLLQPLMPLLGPTSFTLPPPLASPVASPPVRVARIPPPVPLNVRHCVFLI